MSLALLQDIWNTPVVSGQESFISPETLEKYSWFYSTKYEHLAKENVSKNQKNANNKQNNIQQGQSSKEKTDEKLVNSAKTTVTNAAPPQNFKRKGTYPKSDIPYPKLSSLNKNEHFEYVEKYMWFLKMRNCSNPVNKFDSKFEALHKRVIKEQEEFQVFAKRAASESLYKYNYIHPDADVYIKDLLRHNFKRVYRYPRYYSYFETIPLMSLSKDEVKLVHIKSLLEMGKMAAILLPTLKVKTNVPMAYAKISQRYPVSDNRNILEKKVLYKKAVSEDPNAETLAKKYQANVVISSSGMKKIMGNILNNLDSSWEIPIIIKKYDNSDNASGTEFKVAYIDKPFPKKESTYYERSIWYHKFALKSFVCHPRHVKVRHLDLSTSKESNQLSSSSAQDVDDDIFQSQDDLDALETFGTESSIKKSGPKTAVGTSHIEISKKKEKCSKTITNIKDVSKQKKEVSDLNDNKTVSPSKEKCSKTITNIKDVSKQKKEVSDLNDNKTVSPSNKELAENGSASTSNTCTKVSGNDSESENIFKGNDEKHPDSNCSETCLPEVVKVEEGEQSELPASKQISLEDSDSDTERLVIDVDNIQSPPLKKQRTCTNKSKNKINPSKQPDPELKIEEDNCRYSLRSRSRRQRRDSSEKSSDDGHTDLDKLSKLPIKKVIKEEPHTNGNPKDASKEALGKGGLSAKTTLRKSSLPSDDEASMQTTSKFRHPNRPLDKAKMRDCFGSDSSDDMKEVNEPVRVRSCIFSLRSEKVSCKRKISDRDVKPIVHSEQRTSNNRTASKGTSKTKKSSTLDEILDMQEKLLGSKTEHNKNVTSEARSYESKSKSLNIETAEMFGLDPVLLMENENTESYLPPSSDRNITYNLWCLNNLRLIIRNSIDGNIAIDKPYKMNQQCYLYPKLEYQSLYGGEAMSANENIKLWISTLIRRNSKAVRVRIDAFTTEILSVENLDLNQVATTTGFGSFNPENAVRLLYRILTKLTSLAPGNYLLTRNKEDSYLKLLIQTHKSKGGAYDLHSSFNFVLNENPVPCKTIPWNPIDPSVYFRHHTLKHKIPATFDMKANNRGRRPSDNKIFNKKKKKNGNNKGKNQKSKQY